MGGKSSSVTVGYRYFLGMLMGICRKECDELVEIKVGDRTAWKGSVTGNASITIDAPNLFGGDDKEGGIAGRLDVMMGGPTQPVNSRLAAMLGGLVPAFRGVTTMFFDGLVCSMSAYPKRWEQRMRRILKGWDGPVWYPEKAVISLAGGEIKAMNAAHIIYQVLTDRSIGRGLPRARLDDASFRSAADIFYNEGFGLCLKWSRTDKLSSFIQQVLDHAGASIFIDRKTALIRLIPIRGNYDVATLPLFDADSGLLSIEDDDTAAPNTGTNQIIVNYVRPQDNSTGQVKVGNLAALQSAISSETKEYPGIPTPELALRVAQRDLRAASGYIKRFKVRLDRRGRDVYPGSVFCIADPQGGIENIILRAGRFEDGTMTDGSITITALQDVFGLPATSYVDVQPSGWVPPDTTPKVIVNRRLVEVPYRDLALSLAPSELEQIDATSCYLGAIAARPSSLSYNFELLTRLGSSGSFTKRGPGDFCPNGTLSADMPRAAAPTIVTILSGDGLDQVVVGQAAMIDNEILRVNAIDPSTGIATLARGCADTVPAGHAVGARVYFFEDRYGTDRTEYAPGVSVQARMLTRTSTDILPEAAAATDSLTMAQRQYKPYPPGNFKIAGLAYPGNISGALAVTWSHRDRLLQADQLIDTTSGNVGPESGTTYTLAIYGKGNGPSIDSIWSSSGLTITGDTVFRNANENWSSARANVPLTTGKWYWEVAIDTNSTPGSIGTMICAVGTGFSSGSNGGGTSDAYGYMGDGKKRRNSTYESYGAAFAAGDVIGIAVDMDARTVTFYKNGVSQGIAYTGLVATIYPCISLYYIGIRCTFRYSNFAHAAPAGYLPYGSLSSPESLLRTVTDITAASYSYTDAFALADGVRQSMRIVINSRRNGLDSLQRHDVAFERYGLGFHLGESLGGTTP